MNIDWIYFRLNGLIVEMQIFKESHQTVVKRPGLERRMLRNSPKNNLSTPNWPLRLHWHVCCRVVFPSKCVLKCQVSDLAGNCYLCMTEDRCSLKARETIPRIQVLANHLVLVLLFDLITCKLDLCLSQNILKSL